MSSKPKMTVEGRQPGGAEKARPVALGASPLCSVLLTIHVNALSRTLSLGVEYGVLQLGWHFAAQFYMSEPIVLHLEDVGAKILAEAITGAILLFNPYLHPKLLFSR
jgi:hypothetical protein